MSKKKLQKMAERLAVEKGKSTAARVAAVKMASQLNEAIAALPSGASAAPAAAAPTLPVAVSETKRQQLAKLAPGSPARAQFALIHQDELFAEEHAARLATGKVA